MSSGCGAGSGAFCLGLALALDFQRAISRLARVIADKTIIGFLL